MKLAKLSTTRTFGIEIEFNNNTSMSQNELARYINTKFRRLECLSEGYNHTTQAHWKIVTDSTCGLELVSPILSGQKGMKEAQDVIDCLASIEGVRVNRSCGIHVHVGCEDITAQAMKNVLIQYAKNETLINSVLAPSRRDSRWARQIVGNGNNGRYGSVESLKTTLDGCNTCTDVINAMGGRYYTTNVQCWSRQRTIEFRQHGGSLDSTKVLTWTHFLVNMVEKQMTEKPTRTTIMQNPQKAFKQLFGSSKVVYDFMLGRANHFGFTQYGTPNVVEVKRTFVTDCGEMKVTQMTNGSFNVQTKALNTLNEQVWTNVSNTRVALLQSLGIVDSGETTRQLGTMFFSAVQQPAEVVA